jgi:hypothetical protein
VRGIASFRERIQHGRDRGLRQGGIGEQRSAQRSEVQDTCGPVREQTVTPSIEQPAIVPEEPNAQRRQQE